MYIQGKVVKVFDTQSGESTRGTWKKKEFLVETFAKVPKKVNLCLRGEAVDSFQVKEGDKLKVSIDIESREYNGRWYTEIRAWKIEPAEAGAEMQDENNHPF